MENESSGPLSDYNKQAPGYDASRGLSAESVSAYAEMVRRATHDMGVIREVGDIGSGTGRFSSLLREWCGAHVTAIEPHDEMRAIALAKAAPGVDVRSGDAVRTGLGSATCDLVWLAHVVHHLRPLQPALLEMYRVLRPGGRLLVTNGLGDFPAGFPESRWFPETVDIIENLFPTSTLLIEEFTDAGFHFVGRQSRAVVLADTPTQLVDRFSARTLTTLQQLPDTVFDHRLTESRRVADRSGGEQTRVQHHVLRFDRP